MLYEMFLTELSSRPSRNGGSVIPVVKKGDLGFAGFGELYFSVVPKGIAKGWIKHTLMTLNLTVISGKLELICIDDRTNSPTYKETVCFIMTDEKLARLTVPSGVWIAFKCIGNKDGVLMNCADITHDPSESIRKDLEDWPTQGLQA